MSRFPEGSDLPDLFDRYRELDAMAQQNKNSSQPQGFAGFDDLISEFSEDVPVPPQPKAQPAKPVSVSPSPPPKPVTPPPPPPRTDPPKSSSVPHQAPAKPETQVIVEPRPVRSSLPKAAEQGSQKVLWFYVVCGALFLIWLVSGTEKSQTSSRTVSNIEARYEPVTTQSITTTENGMYECYQNGMTFYRTQPCPITTQSITRTEPIYKPKTPLVTEKKSAPEKPLKPKAELDPLIKNIQQKLLSLGYSPGSADGYIGQKTLNAIKQFQQDNRLPIDLEISEKLLSNLNIGQPRLDHQTRQEKPQDKPKNKPQSQVDTKNQGEIEKNQDECVKIRREMNLYSSKMDQKDIDAIVKYDQLYKKYQQICR